MVQSLWPWTWGKKKSHEEIEGKLLLDDLITRNEVNEHDEDKIEVNEIFEKTSVSSQYAEFKTPIARSDETLNFPFLFDNHTISHIQRAKTMFIMRGVSGSGKSTLVNLISGIYKNACVCSADNYFMQNGEYNFDRTLLSYAHEECGEKAKNACMNNIPVIIIDNTHVKRWEMGTYLNLALTYNYPVVIVKPRTWWCNDADKLAELNKHGVSAEIIRAKLRSFEEVTPLYYGWFLDERDSDWLYQLGQKSLSECYRVFPELKNLLILQSPGI